MVGGVQAALNLMLCAPGAELFTSHATVPVSYNFPWVPSFTNNSLLENMYKTLGAYRFRAGMKDSILRQSVNDNYYRVMLSLRDG